MAIEKIDNATLNQKNWSGETTSKNALKKGHLDINYNNSTVPLVIGAGTTFDIDNVMYQVTSDEKVYIGSDETLYYTCTEPGTITAPVLQGSLTSTQVELSVIQTGDSTTKQVVEVKIVSPPTNFNDANYIESGFTIYDSNNDPVNIWFDNGVASQPQPDFGNTGSYYSIPVGAGGLTATETCEAIISSFRGETTPTNISYTITDGVSDDIDVTTTWNVSTSNIISQGIDTADMIFSTTQEGSSSQPEISNIQIVSPPTNYNDSDYVENGFTIYTGLDGTTPINIWFDNGVASQPQPDFGNTGSYYSIPVGVGGLTATEVLDDIKAILETLPISNIHNSDNYTLIGEYITDGNYIYTDGEIISITSEIEYSASKKGYYASSLSNLRIIMSAANGYDSLSPLYYKNNNIIGDSNIDGTLSVTGKTSIDGKLTVGGDSDLSGGYVTISSSTTTPTTTDYAAGTMFFESDTNQLWIYNGSDWKSVTLA